MAQARMGAVILLALARPPLRAVRRHDVPALLGLGIATGLVTIWFLAAIEHIPLGTAVAIEFLGPLTVAAVRSHSRQALVWPAVALLGVVLLTQPWHGGFNPTGVGFAALAAIGWAAYILLTQRIGDRFSGIGALSLTVPIAAVTAAIVGIPQAAGYLTPGILLAAAGLALLLPVLPFALEMLALRSMTPTAVGAARDPARGPALGGPSVAGTLAAAHGMGNPLGSAGQMLRPLRGDVRGRRNHRPRRLGASFSQRHSPRWQRPPASSKDPAGFRAANRVGSRRLRESAAEGNNAAAALRPNCVVVPPVFAVVVN